MFNRRKVTSLRGWTIFQQPTRWPITGQWRARRFGVGIGTTTYDGLISMILARPY